MFNFLLPCFYFSSQVGWLDTLLAGHIAGCHRESRVKEGVQEPDMPGVLIQILSDDHIQASSIQWEIKLLPNVQGCTETDMGRHSGHA